MDIKLPTGAPDPGGGEPAIQRTNPGAADERLRKTGCAADARYKKAACRGEGGTQVRLLVKYSIDWQFNLSVFCRIFVQYPEGIRNNLAIIYIEDFLSR